MSLTVGKAGLGHRSYRYHRRAALERLEERTLLATLELDYIMARRFGMLGPSGHVLLLDTAEQDWPSTAAYINPASGYSVQMTATRSTPAFQFEWRVSGASLPDEIFEVPDPQTPTTFATHTFNLQEGVYTLSVKATGSDGSTTASREIVVNDILIVGMGDSLSSGEGVPEEYLNLPYAEDPDTGTGLAFGIGTWGDSGTDAGNRVNTEAHRSSKAAYAQAALDIERSDWHTSVTFLHVGASGAEIDSGLLNVKTGIEDHGFELPAQVDTVAALVGHRQIDALFLSIGINDIGFSDVLADLVIADPIELTIYDDLVQQIINGVNQKLALLPDKYARLDAALQRQLNVANIYLTEYPDPTRDGNGNSCSEILADLPLLEIDSGEIAHAREFSAGLSNAMRAASAAHGWQFVTGIADAFRTHGYCAASPYFGSPNSQTMRWIRTMTESVYSQGPFHDFGPIDLILQKKATKGTMHPNEFGHQGIKGVLLKQVEPNIVFRTGAPVLDRSFIERFQQTAAYATAPARGFAFGFPNFHTANLGLPIGQVFGTLLIKPAAKVPDAQTLVVPRSATDIAGRFAASDNSAVLQGFAGALPTFNDTPMTFGTLFLQPGVADRRVVSDAELGVDGNSTLEDRFRAVYDFARQTQYAPGTVYVGGYPTFNAAHEVILLKASAAEWRDVPTFDFFSVAVSKDDGDWMHRTTGDWQVVNASAGAKGDYRQSFIGLGENTSTYTLPLAPGRYEFFTRWVPGIRAYDVPFTVWDGATNRIGTAPDRSLTQFLLATSQIADRHFYGAGFPNFQQAVYGNPPGKVYGTIMIQNTMAVASSFHRANMAVAIGQPIASSEDVFRSMDEILRNTPALDSDYAGILPTFDNDLGTQMFGARLIRKAAAIRLDLRVVEDLHLGETSTIEERFAAIDNWARANNFAGGFPNFQQAGDFGSTTHPLVYGAVLLQNAAASRRDIPATSYDVRLTARRDETVPPDAIALDGKLWSSLGSFDIVSGVANVQLSNEASNFLTIGIVRPVVADGVLALRVRAGAPS